MKKVILAIALAAGLLTAPVVAQAAWVQNGLLYSNICRSWSDMNYFYVYPAYRAQPVGTSCGWWASPYIYVDGVVTRD